LNSLTHDFDLLLRPVGSLGPAGDACDRRSVTLDVPHFESEYNPDTDPQGGSHGILPSDADADGWDLGADAEITVNGMVIHLGLKRRGQPAPSMLRGRRSGAGPLAEGQFNTNIGKEV
jgi:hypothetical protein